MMIQDHYEVNVARKESGDKFIDGVERYRHFCRIEINTTYPKEEVEEKFEIITEKFPAPEYKCTLTRVECRGIIEKEV